MQTVIDAIQKETAIDQQKHSCETLICHHQTILRPLSSAAMASARWQVCKLYYPTMYIQGVPGGMDKTTGECSLCETIPI